MAVLSLSVAFHKVDIAYRCRGKCPEVRFKKRGSFIGKKVDGIISGIRNNILCQARLNLGIILRKSKFQNVCAKILQQSLMRSLGAN
jgi:hypothetical protein